VTDLVLVDVAEAMGGQLTQLTLGAATKVTDVTMWALFRDCRNLIDLQLEGATSVTAAGLVPLVRFKPQGGIRVTVKELGFDAAELREEFKRVGAVCGAGDVVVDGEDVLSAR
jgi:hypothetical protein